MKIRFYGTRGSIPICEPQYQEFGGNTTCVLVEVSDNIGILDAGTGIRNLGKELVTDQHLGIDRPVFIAFSHFHWDHIQGLPFFLPAYDAKRHFIISAIGRERYGKDLKSIFQMQMQRDYFPVPLDGMGAAIDFHQTDEDSLVFENVTAKALKHNHPGDAYSFRIEGKRDGKVLVFCTDIEHGDEVDSNIVELAKDADLLIHEAQYTPDELPKHKGWGHSSWEQAVEVAKRASVKKLAITHHDPDHDDAFLRNVEKQVQAQFPNAVLAREKMEIEI
ncbi:MAG TPA: MBL fold metallo-hydrolase [Desulfobacterales bacterium]|nr:MBL fold metallo-hydrolase [Desulfobacterales bacterium]